MDLSRRRRLFYRVHLIGANLGRAGGSGASSGSVLFSPALAFLLVMAVEILIDLLTEVGAPAPLALAAGAFGYFLFRKMSPRPKVAPLYAGDHELRARTR
jgi:hypothetical protein